MEGTTSTGFSFKIEEETLDDYELFEKLEKITSGNELAFAGLPKLLLGEEQEQRLKEHVKKKDGKVTVSGILRETYEILNYDKEIKNS